MISAGRGLKFLIDAQLPRRMTEWIREGGCDAVHTLDLPDGNRTTDEHIIESADSDDRVVITKDGDFAHSHLHKSCPRRLLLVSTGNISNRALENSIGLTYQR